MNRSPMHTLRPRLILLVLLVLPTFTGCIALEQKLSGYTCDQPARVIDPRGVAVEPCCHCEPHLPRCGDTNACWQLNRKRETFFDSLYTYFCENNIWGSRCCP